MPISFQMKWSIFRISLGYCLIQFSRVVVLFHLSRKSQDEKFIEFFSAFHRFHQIEKCPLFFTFSVRPPRLTAVKKWREIKCSLGLHTFAPFFYAVHDLSLGVISYVELKTPFVLV